MKEITLSSQLSYRNNFDFIRFFFAISVLISHFHVLAGEKAYYYWPLRNVMAVSGFFIISGFLVSWSYYKNNNVKHFIKKRAKRIIPAYYVVIISCALIFGLITTLPVREYFFSSQFFKYIAANLTFLNFIEPKLPGVFSENPMQAVNGSLWTLKVEIALYVCVPVIFFFMKKMNKGILFVLIYMISIIYTEYCSYLGNETGNGLYYILGKQFIGQLKYFISGAILLFYFDKFLKYFWPLISISVIVFLLVYFKTFSGECIGTFINYLFPISFAMIIVGFAFKFKYLNNFAKYGDFSYGIYLIRDPVMQTLIYFKLLDYSCDLTLLLTILISISLAALSYHLIEKRFLKRK